MTIKNISQKIISIGTAALMPDESMEIGKAAADTPAIKAMVNRGQLSIEGDTEVTEKTDTAGKQEDLGESGGKPDEEDGGKKPLSRMNKEELLAECKRFGIEVSPSDTNPDLVKKIKAVTAE